MAKTWWMASTLIMRRVRILMPRKVIARCACAGKAYFITQGEPIETKALINGIVQAGGLPPVEKPFLLKRLIALAPFLSLCSTVGIKKEPMTRFVAEQLSTAQ